MAGTTGLEPAASAVTGQRSNQLNYVPFFIFIRLAENPHVYWFSPTSTGSPLVNRFPVHIPVFRGLWAPLDTMKTAFGIPGKAANSAVTQNICPCSVNEL
jgi:hypothetical protein